MPPKGRSGSHPPKSDGNVIHDGIQRFLGENCTSSKGTDHKNTQHSVGKKYSLLFGGGELGIFKRETKFIFTTFNLNRGS